MYGVRPLTLAVAAFLVAAAPGAAQWRSEQGANLNNEIGSQVLTLDQEALFQGSDYGRLTMVQFDSEAAALAVEHRRIEAELEREERALTQRRSLLSPSEFSNLANAFDARVVEIRAQQDAKTRELAVWLEGRRAKFFADMLPVLADVLAETGAVAILQKDVVLIGLSKVDVTALTILRANEKIALPAKDSLPALGRAATP